MKLVNSPIDVKFLNIGIELLINGTELFYRGLELLKLGIQLLAMGVKLNSGVLIWCAAENGIDTLIGINRDS